MTTIGTVIEGDEIFSHKSIEVATHRFTGTAQDLSGAKVVSIDEVTQISDTVTTTIFSRGETAGLRIRMDRISATLHQEEARIEFHTEQIRDEAEDEHDKPQQLSVNALSGLMAGYFALGRLVRHTITLAPQGYTFEGSYQLAPIETDTMRFSITLPSGQSIFMHAIPRGFAIAIEPLDETSIKDLSPKDKTTLIVGALYAWSFKLLSGIHMYEKMGLIEF